ncbi:uncharacterized protein LOC132794914 [Drosophila nasuta]|uniref:uncharacterized protein LOC132794914 n=1 Tax=Drosophila nasuta TaxID=42062 RepID=UPI00295F217F|nr:uncharacterized protein LOC132794914 [Drosophila nasuta]XP_060661192.1 uncharacterized protein LOC132794914 [Drosophila nasuta]
MDNYLKRAGSSNSLEFETEAKRKRAFDCLGPFQKSTGICNYCGKWLNTSANTTNLLDHLKQSTIAAAKLKQAQTTEKPLTLIQEVATRWNRAYEMIKRLLKLNECVTLSRSCVDL